jgi:hypothetical protein
VSWGLREIPNRELGDAYLAFAIAHEVGHLDAPACAAGCTDIFRCEREADESARLVLDRRPYGADPEILGNFASERSRSVIERLATARKTSTPSEVYSQVGSAARECLDSVEMNDRYVTLLRENVEHPRSGLQSHRRYIQGTLEVARERTAELIRQAGVCAKIVQLMPNEMDEQGCYRARIANIQRRASEMTPVHVPRLDSPALWSEDVRWQDDATWDLEASGGLAVGFFREQPTEAKLGWLTTVTALLEGGAADAGGIRLGFGRFGSGSLNHAPSCRGSLARYTAEVVGRHVSLLAPRLALVWTIGLGVERAIPDSAPPHTSGLAAGQLRLAYGWIPRLHLSAGLGYSAATHSWNDLETNLLAISLGLEMHFGQYAQHEPSAGR